VVFSSIKFKYIDAIIATKEALWLWQLFKDLGFKKDGLMCLCDNQSCIKLTQNVCFHNRSKHIELQFHFLLNDVDFQEFKFHFMSTETVWVGILIKVVPKPNMFFAFKLWESLYNIYS